MTKVIIAGGREFNDYERLKRWCDVALGPLEKPIIVLSGKCLTGGDALGEVYAKSLGYKIEDHPFIEGVGKRGGPMRNREMALFADFAILFWDGSSKGTKNMIDQMERVGKKYLLVMY